MSDSTTQLRSTSDCAIVPELGVALGADMLDENIDLDQLVGKIAQKDESALDRLYDHTVQRVYGLALRITQNDGDAEEVVSDVYFQVWNQAKQFDHKMYILL